MTEFLKTLLSLSASGTIIILLLFLMKPFIQNKVSKKWQYYIWLLVIARLLIPFAPEMSLVNQEFHKTDSLVPDITETQSSTHQEEKNAQLNKVMDTSRNVEDSVPEEVGTHSATNMSSIIKLSLISIWLVVALILFIHKVIIYYKFTRYIKRESTEVSAIEYLELLGNAIEHMNIKRTVGLYTNNDVSSPLLVGFLKGSIVLPTLDRVNMDFFILLHELTHYKRRDMFYKWLVQFTICLHWFNPFVHLMGREISHACELSCDEAVIKNLNYENIRTYGDILLNTAKPGGNHNNSLATLALFENKKLLKGRLYAIMNYKKKSKFNKFIMVLLTVAFCGGAICLGDYSSAKSTEAKVTEDSLKVNSNIAVSNMKIDMYSELVDTNLKTVDMDEKSIDLTANKANTKGTTIGLQIEGGNILRISGYYKDSYVFSIGWSKNNARTDKYSTKTVLELSNQSEITVFFDDSCKNDAKDRTVLSALKKLLKQIKDHPDESWMSTVNPIIMKSLYTGTNLEQVAKKYYANDDIWVFSSVFPELDSKLRKEYAEKAFYDDRIDVFSIASNFLGKDDCKIYAKKAYEDDRIDFFCVVSDDLDKDQINTYIIEAYKDDRIDFFSVLSDNLGKEELRTYAKKAYKDDRVDFFSVLSDNLGKEELRTYAKKAYKDDRIDFFSVLSDNLGREELKTYTKKAYADDRIDFFSTMSDCLSKDEIKTYAKKAYEDDRIDFFCVILEQLDQVEKQLWKTQASQDYRIDFMSVLE